MEPCTSVAVTMVLSAWSMHTGSEVPGLSALRFVNAEEREVIFLLKQTAQETFALLQCIFGLARRASRYTTFRTSGARLESLFRHSTGSILTWLSTTIDGTHLLSVLMGGSPICRLMEYWCDRKCWQASLALAKKLFRQQIALLLLVYEALRLGLISRSRAQCDRLFFVCARPHRCLHRYRRHQLLSLWE